MRVRQWLFLSLFAALSAHAVADVRCDGCKADLDKWSKACPTIKNKVACERRVKFIAASCTEACGTQVEVPNISAASPAAAKVGTEVPAPIPAGTPVEDVRAIVLKRCAGNKADSPWINCGCIADKYAAQWQKYGSEEGHASSAQMVVFGICPQKDKQVLHAGFLAQCESTPAPAGIDRAKFCACVADHKSTRFSKVSARGQTYRDMLQTEAVNRCTPAQ